MGDLVNQHQEEQIVQRDDHSWLIGRYCTTSDVMRVLNIGRNFEYENYETIAGFMMFMLRKIPSSVPIPLLMPGIIEVVDIDSYKIDQLLVTRIVNTGI